MELNRNAELGKQVCLQSRSGSSENKLDNRDCQGYYSTAAAAERVSDEAEPYAWAVSV